MRALRSVRLRLRSFFRRDRVDAELQRELRDHLEREIEFHRSRGLTAQEAKQVALQEFGSVALVEDQCRDTRRLNWMDDFRRDTVFAIRSMRRSPTSASVAVLSMALAIGANTAIFSLVNALLLRELPVNKPHELVELSRLTEYGHGYFSHPLYQRFRNENQVFKDVIATSAGTITAQLAGEPVGRYVSANFFDVLGVSPAQGRLLTRHDNEPIAVITDAFWRGHYGRDPSAIGKTIPVDRIAFTIVGVLPRTFRGLVADHPDQFYIPIGSEPLLRRPSWLQHGGLNWLTVIGRLKPGISRDAAEANLHAIFSRHVAEFDSTPRPSHRIVAQSARAGVAAPRRKFSEPLWLLMGAVGAVLLIACANVASLLLARGIARRQEIAVRLALGASRGRMIRQLLTESAALGVAGGLVGFALAIWGTRAVVAVMVETDPTVGIDLHPDSRVLTFSAIVSVGSALLAGSLPAFRAAHPVSSGRTLTPTAMVTRWNQLSVAVQVALSLLLLVGASLLVTSLRNLRTSNVGFEREHVVLMGLNPRKAGIEGERAVTYYRQVLDQVRQTPGVRSAALALLTPIAGGGIDLSFSIAGQTHDSTAMVYVNRITEGYFAAMRIPLLLGRDLEEPGVVINQALADRYFPYTTPLGQRVRVGRDDDLEVVGVVGNTKYRSLREDDQPIAFLPALPDSPASAMTLVVGTTGDPKLLARSVRHNAQAVSAAVPITEGLTLTAHIDRSLLNERLMTRIVGMLALVALTLAAVGLYGMLGYVVTIRIPEIGVRLALGASPWAVLRSIAQQTVALVSLGIVVGLGAALVFTRFLSNLLFGVTPTDVRVLMITIICMFVVTLIAAARPAWRATRVNPLVALRYE